jgi:hypothetical protein
MCGMLLPGRFCSHVHDHGRCIMTRTSVLMRSCMYEPSTKQNWREFTNSFKTMKEVGSERTEDDQNVFESRNFES